MRPTILFTVLAASALAHARPAPAPTPDDDDDGDPEATDDALPAVAPLGSATTLLAEARRELAAVRESHYAHHTAIDEARGVFDYDCSGFVGYALARAAPHALAAVTDATRPRPLAKDFYAFFTQPHGPWRSVARVADLAPGDVVAWLEPPAKHSRNTGHVMIVEGVPAPGARTGEYVISVMDSSHSGHDARDARIREHRNGLGIGAIVLLADASGRPTGYRWSTAARSVAYSTSIAFARLVTDVAEADRTGDDVRVGARAKHDAAGAADAAEQRVRR